MVKSKKVPASLDNKYILYVVFLASFASLIGYLLKKDYASVVAFILAALALRTITRNMIIVLGIPFVAVALMKVRVKEGMTNEDDKEDDKEDENEEDKEQRKETKKAEKANPVARSSPAAVDDDAADSVNRVDFAATMKQAYDDLQGVLDKDGIKALSKETQQLVEQQKALMTSLNTMAPILKDAKSSLKGFNIPDIKNMIASLKQ